MNSLGNISKIYNKLVLNYLHSLNYSMGLNKLYIFDILISLNAASTVNGAEKIKTTSGFYEGLQGFVFLVGGRTRKHCKFSNWNIGMQKII